VPDVRRKRTLIFLAVVAVAAVASLAISNCHNTGTGGGGGGGGGGGIVSTPTPDLNADLPQWGLSTDPVPEHIRQATGATTWPEVVAWMDAQMAAAGIDAATFAGSFGVTIDPETGEVTGVELVEPTDAPDDPPVEPPSPSDT